MRCPLIRVARLDPVTSFGGFHRIASPRRRSAPLLVDYASRLHLTFGDDVFDRLASGVLIHMRETDIDGMLELGEFLSRPRVVLGFSLSALVLAPFSTSVDLLRPLFSRLNKFSAL